MRISDWSSDVCSSDLWLAADTYGYRSRFWMTYRQAQALGGQVRDGERSQFAIFYKSYTKSVESPVRPGEALDEQSRVLRSSAEIGRAACRERVCQYVLISVVDVSLTKKTKIKKKLE